MPLELRCCIGIGVCDALWRWPDGYLHSFHLGNAEASLHQSLIDCLPDLLPSLLLSLSFGLRVRIIQTPLYTDAVRKPQSLIGHCHLGEFRKAPVCVAHEGNGFGWDDPQLLDLAPLAELMHQLLLNLSHSIAWIFPIETQLPHEKSPALAVEAADAAEIISVRSVALATEDVVRWIQRDAISHARKAVVVPAVVAAIADAFGEEAAEIAQLRTWLVRPCPSSVH
mmetsp:Transcript_21061/g.31491  ORF Transcript_21061/g.31491 Transcript_21061/m.31491 type:complete len:225 (+) Transcript_21061:385-1059(+)